MSIEDRFEKFDEDYLEFERIPEADRPSQRPDLCAMIYLDKKFPSDSDIVCHAEHDEIWLDCDNPKKLTDEDVLYLVRCGVRCDGESLQMFT